MQSSSAASRIALGCALAIAAALLVSPWLGHFDDTDAHTYQVVARKMAQRRGWLDPAYLDHLYPHFREHLPFGLWPFAAADLISERAAPAVAALFSFFTLLVTAAAAQRLFGAWGAALAVLTLGTTETFFRYGGATRLDPALVFFSTAAALPLLGEGRPSASSSLLPAVTAATAILVKGPFGVAPLLAAGSARGILDRSRTPVLRAMAIAGLASLPFLGFLAWDRLVRHGGFWDTYVKLQVLGSATGARRDGSTALLFPFASVAGRFWPGLPLVAVSAALALRKDASRSLRLALLFALFVLAFLCIPARKVWNHALIAYPPLALCAAGVATGLRGWLDRHAKLAAAAGIALAAGAIVAVPAIGELVDGTPCLGSSEFATALDGLPPGAPVLVVSPEPEWRLLASLAAERRLEPVPLDSLPEGENSSATVALVQAPHPVSRGWHLEREARGWMLLRRGPAP